MRSKAKPESPAARSARATLRALGSVLLLACALGAVAARSADADRPPAAHDASELWFAQPLFETVGDSESIPYGVVTALAYDAQGVQWIGTQVGLVRYDGYRFRKYVHEADNPASLPSSFVRSLWPTADGRLWVGTENGLALLDPATGRAERYSHDPQRPGSINSGTAIWALAGTAAGDLWIGSDRGLDCLPAGGSEFRHYRRDPTDPASLADDRIRALLIDRAGTLWVGSHSGLQRRRPDGQGFEHVSAAEPGGFSLTGVIISSLFAAADGKLWIGTLGQGAGWLDPNSGRLHRVANLGGRAAGLDRLTIDAIAQPDPRQIWLGTRSAGLVIVDSTSGQLRQQVRHDAAIASSLALDNIGALALDRAGLLAVGTWGGGLQRFNPQGGAFKLLRHSPTDARGLSHRDVHGMLELPTGEWLVGTGSNGIDRIDRRDGRVGGYRPEPGRPGALAAARANRMARTPDGSLWVVSGDAGMQRLAPDGRTWRTFSLADGLPHPVVSAVLVDRKGRLWVGTQGGLARWEPQRQRFASVAGYGGRDLFHRVLMIHDDAAGRLWVASGKGLWVLEPNAAELRVISHQPGRESSLSSDAVNGLLVDRQGRLWVDTSAGLDRLVSWDGAEAQFEHISAAYGHPGLYLGANLLEDKLGRIWTQWHVLDPARKRIDALTRADGFDIGTGWVGAYTQTRDGRFLFGGTQGLAVVEPEAFQPWTFAPPLVATELKIDGQIVPVPTRSQELELRPGQRGFALEFAALDYSAPHKLRYRYRLQGYEDEWIDTNADNRVAAYSNLAPGRYVLQVRGSNRLGDWSPHELAFPVRVLPAWYQTLAFRLLAAALAVAAMYLVVRWRTGVLRHRQIALEQEVAARTADLRSANENLQAVNQELALSAETLRLLGEIGRDITAHLDAQAVFETLHRHVSQLMHAPTLSIFRLNASGDALERMYGREDGLPLPPLSIALDDPTSNAAYVARERRDVLREISATEPDPNLVPGTRQMLTVLFAPLIAGERLLGVMSVQSDRAHAYGERERQIFRSVCAYGAIALANTEAQAQLIQTEKMASLGQLVANVAHEINTPIAAVKSSGENIATALDQLLGTTAAFGLLDQATRELVARLVGHARNRRDMLSSREERALVREVSRQLQAAGIAEAEFKARLLVELNAQDAVADYLPLLRHPACELIMRRAEATATIINGTANINLAAERVAKIVFALKAYSRIDRGGTMQEAQLTDGLETVLTLYQNQIKHGVELVRHYEEIPPLRCFADELNQVWTNLIHNALQAMQHRGSLTIGVRRAGDAAVVSIGDSGCGIPETIRARIFDPFFTTKPTGEGSGLGLDIVRKIVEKHHGCIEFDSTVGVGTTFTVRLPYTTPEATA